MASPQIVAPPVPRHAEAGRPAPTAPPTAAPAGRPGGGPAAGGRAIGWRRLLGAVVASAGILLLLFVSYLYGLTGFAQARSQHRLLERLALSQASHRATPLPGHSFASGDPVALLAIPVLHLSQVVVAGTSAADLEQGPGLMPGSRLPGDAGNIIIAGRRTTYGAPFRKLASLRAGELVRFTTGQGSFRYRVVRVAAVPPGAPLPVGASSDNRLTLITSNPPFRANGRLIAVAELIGRPAGPAVPQPVLQSSAELNLAGDPNALAPAVLWTQALLAALIGAVVGYRRWRRSWVVWLLATPVLLATAYLSCQYLARLLPAAL